MYDKVVPLGNRLRYPITITKLLKKPGDKVKKQEHIIEYKFSWKREVNENEFHEETTYTEFDSPAEGVLKEWRIEEGMVISADMPCMTVEEACGHEVQIQGLCSLCGADMTETDWANPEARDTDRAMINMTHDQTGLMVSASVAMKAEHDTQKRLLRQRKLSLVVDLDQTIIHACIDPTVGEWQSDKNSPNYESVKHVRSFQLSDDGPRGVASGCTYYIKLRPGLTDFLQEISEMYELHVYTMGTRAYAQHIAQIVDPDKKLFGNRVISRDENGSITAKSLQRLFPVSTNMVVIIDDRADVWPMNRPNLIKVAPYDFFKGIGDINSSFLPKRRDILPARLKSNGTVVSSTADVTSASNSTNVDGKVSPVVALAAMAVDDEEALKQQTEEQEKTLEKQLTERPLQHMQEELEKEEEEAATDPETGENPPVHHRHNLLVDDDEELTDLQDHLTDLHREFYETYDKRREERKDHEGTHRPGESKPRRKSVDDGVDLSMVPDVGDILDELKMSVLSGTVLCLSGLVPIGTRLEDSELVQQAQAHGAQVIDTVGPRVTHLVVATARPNTKKVEVARKIPSIHIVDQSWLMHSLGQWRHLDESAYYINPPADIDADSDYTRTTGDGDSVVQGKGGIVGNIDWADADKEMAEFLGEDFDDDDDSESEGVSDVSSEGDGDETRGVKRFRNDDGESENESALAKKQRVARSRGASTLRSVTANGDEDVADYNNNDDDEDLDELEAELERELIRELEAADV